VDDLATLDMNLTVLSSLYRDHAGLFSIKQRFNKVKQSCLGQFTNKVARHTYLLMRILSNLKPFFERPRELPFRSEKLFSGLMLVLKVIMENLHPQ
jgi:hypothetical protein